MKNRKLSIILIVLSISIVGFIGITNVAAAKTESGVHPLEEMALMDLTHENFVGKGVEVAELDTTIVSPDVAPGEEFPITVSDNGLGIDYDETFVVVLEGEHGIILIDKLAYESFDDTNYYFANPYGNGTLPWYRTQDVISHDQLVYMLDQLDNVIYPTNALVFGEPAPRGDEGTKVWTLIFNIRDESYYDMENHTSYIAGYFSSSESNENNKNIMHIDTYDWPNRVGPDVDRPYLYEGVFAHEQEHMIHFDIDPDEPSWTDEGLADLAGFLCGYGHSSGHIAYYMIYHPYTALTFWGGELEDYGASYLFQLYLYEKFGGAPFVSALVQEQANGIEGIEIVLAAFGYTETFDEIFDAWTIANYLDDTKKAGGKYGYDTLDVGTIDTWGYSILYALENYWWGPPLDFPLDFTASSYWGGAPQPYTAQYWTFTNDKAADVWVDGDDTAGTPAFDGTYEWYSGAQSWSWRSFNQTFAIPAGGATLNFMTFFEIEGNWDYGYVEVYDHYTELWSTLDAPGTVDFVAHGQDNPNTPDEREPTAYEAAGSWHAFTGASGGWTPVSMDLSSFAGHSIDVYFTLWQDGAFTLQNMYVDNIAIPEIDFIDDVEGGEDGWASTGWYVTDGILENGWSVTVIETKWVPTARYPEPIGNNAQTLHSIRNMNVDPLTQAGTISIPATPAKSRRVQVTIVSNRADHILTSDYWIGWNW